MENDERLEAWNGCTLRPRNRMGRECTETIKNLKEIFGDTACDAQHIGSTAIVGIKAKPIIDIAVGVKSFANLDGVLSFLEESSIYTRSNNRFSSDCCM